jgi:hypothetical protein
VIEDDRVARAVETMPRRLAEIRISIIDEPRS